MAVVVCAVFVLVALLAVQFRAVMRGRAPWLLVAPVGMVVVGAALGGRPEAELSTKPRGEPGDYATSLSCRKCHTEHYASWYATYHRTMTREATAETVLGDFGDGEKGVAVEVGGVTWRLFRWRVPGGEEHFYMETLDPERHGPWRAARTIGSHKVQVYLTPQADGSYVTLPLVYHLGWRQWVSENGSMLRPEEAWVDERGRMRQPGEAALLVNSTQWNDRCIFCHNTKARPGMTPVAGGGTAWQTRVEELGIACEACHGPGVQHAAAQRNPLRRIWASVKGNDAGDPTIVNPERLAKELSVEACGRCHGKFGPDGEQCYLTAMTKGDLFVPGTALPECYVAPLPENLEESPVDAGRYYWPNETPRATGTEYLGTVLSPCYQRGEMTCLSCHSLHESDPVDQLAAGKAGNRGCIQCHEQYESEERLVEHTRHAVGSSGSRCYNCHMPYQTFGIMSVNRTHRIVSPSAAVSARRGGEPLACNQCHLDKTLAWSAARLNEWYGHELPQLDGEQRSVAESVLRLLRGDAIERLVAAWSLGWEEAQATVRPEWAAPFLIETLDDDYPAVRQFAYRSLLTLRGFERAAFDFLARPVGRRERAIEDLRRRWAELAAEAEVPEAVPLGEDRMVEEGVLLRLLGEQDKSVVNIVE